MNKHKTSMLILISAILAIIIYVSYGMLNTGKKEQYHTVSVLLDSSSADQWNALREGLEQGAQDHHIHLNIVSAGELLSLKEECTLISRELEGDTEGLIVELCWEDSSELFEQSIGSKPVVLVKDNLQKGNLYSAVVPDPQQLGQVLGDAVKDSQDNSGTRVGILAGKENKGAQKMRIQGIQKAFEDTDYTIEWIFYDDDPVYQGNLPKKIEDHPVDILAALNDETTELAVDCLLEHTDLQLNLYGEARSEKAVYYLDKGLIETLIVSNDFYMGYRSVELMAQKLNYHVSDIQQDFVEIFSISQNNMHDPDIEKILFPTIR